MAINPDTNLVIDEQIDVQSVTADNDVLLDQLLIDKLIALGVDGIDTGTDATTGFPPVVQRLSVSPKGNSD